MKYTTYILFIILSLSSFGQIQKTESSPNLQNMSLYGNVKSIFEESYLGQKEGNKFITLDKKWHYSWGSDSQLIFDSLGHLIEKRITSKEGDFKIEEFYHYRANQLIESKTKYFQRKYEYDEIGKISKETVSSARRGYVTINGKKSTDSIDRSEILYRYNNNFQVLQKIESDLRSEPNYIAEFKYDKSGNIISERIKYSFLPSESHDYKYDQNNQLIEYKWSDSKEGLLEKTSYEYLDGNLRIELWENFEDGEKEGSVKYTYENGLPIEIIETDNDGEIIEKESIRYDYDTNGNWTKKISIVNENEIYIITRKIEYFE